MIYVASVTPALSPPVLGAVPAAIRPWAGFACRELPRFWEVPAWVVSVDRGCAWAGRFSGTFRPHLAFGTRGELSRT
eukprot:3190253-Amphidinium_carterae.1